jgi:uncharacterized protein YoxC
VEFRPMSPDEIQRTLQFLLNHQAQFATDFEKLSGKVDGLADSVAGVKQPVNDLTGSVGHTVGLVGRIGTVVESLTITLAAAQQRNDEQFRRTDTRIGELGERLDRVIQMFERHLRDDHGYGPS